jgi:hypothetical protein
MSTPEALVAPPGYPVRLDVDYPDRDLDRLSTLLRLFMALPIVIILGLVGGATLDTGAGTAAGTGGLLVLPTGLMIIFRRRYPRWWFDFNRELSRFGARVGAYIALLDDQYPSTVDEQSVHLEIDYPDVERDLNRFMPLVKWLLSIPHVICLIFLWIGAVFVVIFAWFAILVTGRYPRGAFDYVVGVARWQARVAGYSTLLVTDRYPPFSLR